MQRKLFCMWDDVKCFDRSLLVAWFTWRWRQPSFKFTSYWNPGKFTFLPNKMANIPLTNAVFTRYYICFHINRLSMTKFPHSWSDDPSEMSGFSSCPISLTSEFPCLHFHKHIRMHTHDICRSLFLFHPSSLLFLSPSMTFLLYMEPWAAAKKALNQLPLNCHQLLSGFLAKGYFPRMSRQSRRSLW